MPEKGTHWMVPPMWKGETVFVVGGGPSLRGADLSPLADRHVIGVNAAFRLGPWVDVCWFGDAPWFDANVEALRLHPAVKASCHERLLRIPWVRVLRRGKPAGIETRRDSIAWNGNSGGSAVNLAVHLGAVRIVLLGFDMRTDEGGKHNWHEWHNEQKGRLTEPPRNIYEQRFLPRMEVVAADLRALGVECLNASPDSAMEYFPKITLADALRLR
jgi:hypothetical protein